MVVESLSLVWVSCENVDERVPNLVVMSLGSELGTVMESSNNVDECFTNMSKGEDVRPKIQG